LDEKKYLWGKKYTFFPTVIPLIKIKNTYHPSAYQNPL